MIDPESLLVIGASGPTGRCLLPLLHASGVPFVATSRHARDEPGTAWRVLALEHDTSPCLARTVLSLGPMDHLAGWLHRVQTPNLTRVLALGSISVRTKVAAPLPGERAVAARLAEAEHRLQELGTQRSVSVTIVRAGMIWDGRTDRNVVPILEAARRWRCLPYPNRAGGRRNPIACTDLARIFVALLTQPATSGVIEVGGPETLDMRTMVQKLARSAGALAIPMPGPLLNFIARSTGASGERLRQVLTRWDQDQLAPAHPLATTGFLQD
ncbi:MAG: hypothetical protein IPK97_21185 [Ahniella sp.]|nr:hypothetical protein [Ahniella sp.]